MPGQNHRERDHCDHHIQVEADVEEAESSFGAEAFRPLGRVRLRVRSNLFFPWVLGFIDLWPLVPYICVRVLLLAVPACDIRGHGELKTKAQATCQLISPNWWSRNGVGIAQNLATILLTPISLPLSRWSTGPPCPFQKKVEF